jgi:hypothetical protein
VKREPKKTYYSKLIKGSTGNWRRDARFDVTGSYVGISTYEGANKPIARVLLTAKQFAAQEMRRPSRQLRALVSDYIRAQGATGATCDEVELWSRLPHQTCGPRIRELVQLGLVVDSGTRRPTRSGRAAIVWRVAC